MSIEYIGKIVYDDKLLQSERKIVIFGTGICGKRIMEYLDKRNVRNQVICFCDSNSKMEDRYVMGIPVCNPDEACERYPDADYLISGKYSREMYKILKNNYVDKLHILVF